MENFTFYSPTYFMFGKDAENHAGELVKRFGARQRKSGCAGMGFGAQQRKSGCIGMEFGAKQQKSGCAGRRNLKKILLDHDVT